MTYQNILDAAIRLVAENATGGDIADYTDRAGYLLASYVSEAAETDRRYRKAHGMDDAVLPGTITVPLTDTFPLVDALVPSATFYLASMLVVDENETMSDKFFGLYTDEICSVRAALPLTPEKIKNKYRGSEFVDVIP